MDKHKNLKKIILNDLKNEPLIIENNIKNDFFVQTLDKVLVEKDVVGYILVSEQANDISVAVKERKDFIIRTVVAIALVIFIFSTLETTIPMKIGIFLFY